MKNDPQPWPVASLLLALLCTACGGGSIQVGNGGAGGGAATPTTPTTPTTPASPASPASLLAACPVGASPASVPGSLAAVVDALVQAELSAQGLPGMTVAIARHGTLLYTQAYGHADLGRCTPALPATRYQIGSVTKQFTAAAVLQLQLAGKVDLDRPVAAYLPGHALAPAITVRMLLNQTAGLADYLDFPAPGPLTDPLPLADVLDAIGHAPLVFAPGSAYAYSNSNYYLLGALIEAVSGQPYGSYLAANIFQPLGLNDTSYQQPAQAALPYSYDAPAEAAATGLAAGMVPDPSVFYAAGALWSNVLDLAKWDAALLAGRLLPPAQWAALVTPPASVPMFQQAAVPSPYAMGWVSQPLQGRRFAWHNGKTLSYTAFNGVFLDSGLSISLLTNADVREDTPLLPLALQLAQQLCQPTSGVDGC